MAQTLYWYDLETSGTEPRWDRIVQLGGFRTDMDLNPIGDEIVDTAPDRLALALLPAIDRALHRADMEVDIAVSQMPASGVL